MPLQDEIFPVPDWTPPSGLCVLRAKTSLASELPEIDRLASSAPFRRMQVPGGGMMSVETTSAGAVGWCSDRQGYRYTTHDPLTGRVWPSIPKSWTAFARTMAEQAGFDGFEPDSCLINRYAPGAKMGAHQDADEQDFTQPIVSVSLGLAGTFVWLGPTRVGHGHPIDVRDGDVVVFGGPARHGYHRVKTVRADPSGPAWRINLTFRRAQ